MPSKSRKTGNLPAAQVEDETMEDAPPSHQPEQEEDDIEAEQAGEAEEEGTEYGEEEEEETEEPQRVKLVSAPVSPSLPPHEFYID